jgi:hypothetical protein
LISLIFNPKKPGRRPGGLDGARISDYPQASIRLHPYEKQKLKDLGIELGEPLEKVVIRLMAEFIEAHREDLSSNFYRKYGKGSYTRPKKKRKKA